MLTWLGFLLMGSMEHHIWQHHGSYQDGCDNPAQRGETGSNWAYYFPMLSQLCHCRECLFVTTLHNDMLSLKTSNTYLITVSFFPPELWQCIAMHSIRWFLLVRAFPVWNSFLFCIFLTSRPAHLGSTLCHSVSLGAALLQNLDSCACKIE